MDCRESWGAGGARSQQGASFTMATVAGPIPYCCNNIVSSLLLRRHRPNKSHDSLDQSAVSRWTRWDQSPGLLGFLTSKLKTPPTSTINGNT